MWGSLDKVKRVPNAAAIVKPFSNRRKAATLFGSIQHNNKLSTDHIRGRRAFQGAKANYPRLEKITFALIVTSWKMRHYFQAHPIVFMTDQRIRKTLNKINATGRLVQWAIELGHFDIEYRPQVAIKAQVLANFIAKFTYPQEEEEPQKKTWKIQTDGSATKKAGGTGVVLISPEGEILKYVFKLQFLPTNNEAEYEALLTGLSLARILKAKTVIIKADSQLVVG